LRIKGREKKGHPFRRGGRKDSQKEENQKVIGKEFHFMFEMSTRALGERERYRGSKRLLAGLTQDKQRSKLPRYAVEGGRRE